MNRQASTANDVSHIVQLLGHRYGTSPLSTSLRSLRRRNPQLDQFDWSLLIICIDIDLRVSVPQRLIDADQLTIADFAKKIASLPKITETCHTLEMLTVLAQALLNVDDAAMRVSPMKKRLRRAKARTHS